VRTDLTFKTRSGDLVLHRIRESNGYVSWVLSYYEQHSKPITSPLHVRQISIL